MFTVLNVLNAKSSGMKPDAFDDVVCPFDYKAEIAKARDVLNGKVAEYVLGHPKESYRNLARKFHLSPASLCAIGRRNRTRKPGRPRGRKVIFSVCTPDTGEPEAMVTITTKRRGISDQMMRDEVARYFQGLRIAVNRGHIQAKRHLEWNYDELEGLSVPISYRKRECGIEMDLDFLRTCTAPSEQGDVAFQNVVRWLEKRHRDKALRDLARRLVSDYAKLRGI
jgi:hypothetical protein